MNKGKLNGKVAVVTGASKGIGAAIAKEFANEGATVVINYASAKEDADRIVDEINKRGGQAVAGQANVAKKADVERLFIAAKKSEPSAQPFSTKAIFSKALKRRHHSVASVNPATSLRLQSFLLHLIPRGSQAKRFVLREVFVRPKK